jgi:uncharacterized protein YhbP (UPF0306 family)
MTGDTDLADIARDIIDSNHYMALGTADEGGRPWVSPVYYVVVRYTEFLWVSSPEAVHSRNIATRRDVAISIFDSRAAVGAGQGVYISAEAEELAGGDLESGIEAFSRRSVAHGAREWTAQDVRPPLPHRLYHAIASAHSVLDPDGQVVHGRTADRRRHVRLSWEHHP